MVPGMRNVIDEVKWKKAGQQKKLCESSELSTENHQIKANTKWVFTEKNVLFMKRKILAQ